MSTLCLHCSTGKWCNIFPLCTYSIGPLIDAYKMWSILTQSNIFQNIIRVQLNREISILMWTLFEMAEMHLNVFWSFLFFSDLSPWLFPDSQKLKVLWNILCTQPNQQNKYVFKSDLINSLSSGIFWAFLNSCHMSYGQIVHSNNPNEEPAQ